MTPLTIITGTGRCGSTMLSDLLAADPDVLVLSEYIVSLSPWGAPPGAGTDGHRCSGAAFWDNLATPRRKPNTLLRAGVRVPEFRYPVGRGRFAAGEIPAISLVTLPTLTDDPDGLFDELAAEVPAWPEQPIARHHRRLVDWLARRLGRTVAVERSGGSLRFLPSVAAMFPDARIVHLHRDGPACAMSMRNHPSFRLAVVLAAMRPTLGVDPYHEEPSPAAVRALPPELRAFLPDEFDARALADADLAAHRFGELWSHGLVSAAPVLRGLPAERLLTMGYEEVLADPATELRRLAEFVGLADPAGWATGAATGVGSPRRARVPADEDRALRRACRPGRLVAELVNPPLRPAGAGVAR